MTRYLEGQRSHIALLCVPECWLPSLGPGLYLAHEIPHRLVDLWVLVTSFLQIDAAWKGGWRPHCPLVATTGITLSVFYLNLT